jgi:hypothetical protein
MDVWVEKIKSHLKKRWSISALHDFDDLGSLGGSYYRRTDDVLKNVLDGHGFSIVCKYSAYMEA